MPSLIDRRSTPLVLGFLVVVACGDERARVNDESSRREQGSQAPVATEWPCEKESFPCTWEEVEAGVAERSRLLGEEALDRFVPGGVDELVAWLAAQPDVADVEAEEATVVRFRLEDGRFVYIENHGSAVTSPRSQDTSSEGPPRTLFAAAHPLSTVWGALANRRVSSSPSPGVTGRDRNSDERVNQRDQRKALVLEPNLWEWCYADLDDSGWINLAEGIRARQERRELAERVCDGERGRERLVDLDMRQGVANPRDVGYSYESRGARVKAALESVEAYKGNVTYLADEAVTLQAFEGWGDYDVIHYASHGSRRSITLGAFVNWGEGRRPRGPLASRRGVSPWLAKTWGREGAPRRWVWSADHRFFRGLYAQGLDRTLFFASTCKTLGNPSQPTTALIEQLLGRQSMFVGWGASPSVDYAQIAVNFYTIVGQGWSGEEAIRLLPEFTGGDYDEPVYAEDLTPAHGITEEDYAILVGVTVGELRAAGGIEGWERNEALEGGAVLGSRGSDMRIREVAWLLHPPSPLLGSPTVLEQPALQDGDDLARLVVGALGDGKHELLRVSVEVEALDEVELSSTNVRLELDGEQIGKTRSLDGAREINYGEDGHWAFRLDLVGDKIVKVGKDLEPGKEYELEAVVDLPEGGESRYAVKLLTEVCRSARQGDLEGTLSGGNARTFERGDRGNFAKLFLDGPGRPSRLQIEVRQRRDYQFNVNVPLDQPPESGSRYMIQDRAIEVLELGGGLNVRGAGYGGRRDLSLGWHVGTVRVSIDQVSWREKIPDRTNLRGWACGEIEADLVGYGEPLPGSMTPVQVPHTFKARFWAEITRPATAP